MPGLGTALNMAAVLAGSAIGVLIGERLPHRTRDLVTDGIGLVTLMVAVLDGASVLDPSLRRAVGSAAPVLIVLGAILVGGIAGSALRIEERLDRIGALLQRRLTRAPTVGAVGAGAAGGTESRARMRLRPAGRRSSRGGPVVPPGPTEQRAPRWHRPSARPRDAPATGVRGLPPGPTEQRAPRWHRPSARPRDAPATGARGLPPGPTPPDGAAAQRDRFIQGFVTASMIYCVGPLTVLGALQDGLGRGISQFALKSVLDGFTSIALAASLGWGVAAAALSVLVIQGGLTAAAAAIGGLLSSAEIAAITATGGLLLAGIAIRLLRLRAFPVADLLPALVVAPLITEMVAVIR